MFFASDNWAGAHPAIGAALAAHSTGFAAAYGASQADTAAEAQFHRVFGREVGVYFVATGTAANALALASVNRPGGVVFCHSHAHVIEDECGAVEYFTGGARLHPVHGENGKIGPEALEAAIGRFPPGFVHAGQPMAVTITQASEAGTIYSLSEIRAIAAVCQKHGLPLHMDGARFANALVALGCGASEMTVDCGVDLLSFGGTKNGCWCAEALVVLNSQTGDQMPFLRKRAAQLFSKSRFIAAQFEAYLKDDLWLDLATHANAMASALAGHARGTKKLRLGWEPQANEVFVIMDNDLSQKLKAQGAAFYPWALPASMEGTLGKNEILTRFVTSFATTRAEVDAFGDLVR